MKNLLNVSIVCAGLVLLATSASGQAQTNLKTLRVASVSTNAAMSIKNDRKGKGLDMGQVISALRGRVDVAFRASKKFNMIEDAALGRIVDGQQLQNESGIFDPKTAPKTGKIKAAEFVVFVDIDHFVDSEVETTFADGQRGYKRRLQLGGIVKVDNMTTGESLAGESIESELMDTIILPAGEVIEKERLEELLPKVMKDFADKVVQATDNQIHPMKVLLVDDDVVTINRNAKSGIKVGEMLSVFGKPVEIVDEDSGQKTRVPGKLLGKVRISYVDVDTSQGQIIEAKDKAAITAGCFLRRQSAPSGGKN